MKLRSNRQLRSAFQPKPQQAPKPQARTFTIFSQLPIELRQIIWRMTLQPRMVEIQSRPGMLFTQTPQPATLFVSKDSRAAVIFVSYICLNEQTFPVSKQLLTPSKLYPTSFSSPFMATNVRFNFLLDTLFISRSFSREDIFTIYSFFNILSKGEIESLRSMAISGFVGFDDDEENEARYWNNLKPVFGSFPALTELSCMIDPPVDPSEENSVDKWWELFEEYPSELAAGQRFPEGSEYSSDHLPTFDEYCGPEEHLQDWDLKNKIQIKRVWGFRGAKYLEYA
jgi:hypothetical protein